MIVADVSAQLSKVASARRDLNAAFADACDKIGEQFPDDPQLRIDLVGSVLGAPIGVMVKAMEQLDPKLRPDRLSCLVILEIMHRLDAWVKSERRQ